MECLGCGMPLSTSNASKALMYLPVISDVFVILFVE